MEYVHAELELSVDRAEVSLPDNVNFNSNGLDDKIDNANIEEMNNSSKTVDTPRSKRELKRERKLQKRLQMRAEWKLQRKLKKERRKTLNKIVCSSNTEKPRITSMDESTNKLRVVIDFSYDELMSTKDLIKCGNQVVRCYSANRRSLNPLQLHFCNFSGKIQEEMSKCYEYGKWDIHFHEDTYTNVFPKEVLVYLTSESKNVLETLDENKVYIIGGLVDHNAHKGVSYRKAVLEGIAHAQLPIKKHIQMKSRSVLTINHVFEILLKVSNDEPWSEVLRKVLPQRFLGTSTSGQKKKDTSEGSSSDENTREDESDSTTYDKQSLESRKETTNPQDEGISEEKDSDVDKI